MIFVHETQRLLVFLRPFQRMLFKLEWEFEKWIVKFLIRREKMGKEKKTSVCELKSKREKNILKNNILWLHLYAGFQKLSLSGKQSMTQ